MPPAMCGVVGGGGGVELGIVLTLIVSPAVYPCLLEIAELARSLCHS